MKTPKLLIGLLIAATPGVLLASTETDRKIEDAATSSYNYKTVLQGHVKVKVKDGVVTLTGTLPDAGQKDLAEDTVSNLPGVTRVDDRIEVKSAAPKRSDDWIAFKINSSLLMHANVSAANTKVDVTNGVVTLTGEAENSAQKDLTTLYAKEIEGVKSVNNQMAVNPKSNPALGDTIDDASITAQVKYALLAHRSTSAMKTKIETQNGVVTISGEASTDAEKSLVTKLAEGVRGVKSVTNNMTVKM
ncbi:MAG TPA: BON domain-containing protein [Opitutaceae bacterium]|nr:BON domain-containing protein [Opitutaceae bacterium]